MTESFSMADFGDSQRDPTQQTLLFISRAKSAKDCLRIRVIAGSDCEKTLGVGEMPFLHGIGLLQRAERFGTNVDPERGRWLRMCLNVVFREEAQNDKVNRWDPWLFRIATGSRDDQMKFYSKVWRLHMHFDGHIFVSLVSQLATLRLVEPDFIKLEVRVTLDVGAGEARYHTLTRDDEEGVSLKQATVDE